MANIRRFHPGYYIKNNLEAMDMTAKEFSFRTGISERTLSAIINGNGDITFDVAYKLSLFFDSSISLWTNLQTLYNEYINEKLKESELEEECKLISSVKKYLIEIKCIDENDNKKDIVYKCRKLVGVNSLLLLKRKDSFVCLKEQSITKETDYFYQNFWIALSLNVARKKNKNNYNKQFLIESIDEIRKLTIEDASFFYPKLQEIFTKCGISFVLLPYLPKSNIYGATKWFSKDNVMLSISNRSGKADLFWFTLFHEISHVLMEHRRETLMNMKDNIDIEADNMATDMLISKASWNKFVSENNFTKESIEKFADEIEIHPCIVLGRLQKEKRVPYNKFNDCFNLKYQINII